MSINGVQVFFPSLENLIATMGKRRSEEEKKSRLLRKLRRIEKKIHKLDSDTEDIPSTSKVLASNSPDKNSQAEDENIFYNEFPNEDTEMETPVEDTLDNSILEILGVVPESKEKEENLKKELVERWDNIIKKGLDKEGKETLRKENPGFNNFLQMFPPKLNPEVNAAISDPAKKRDQTILRRQEQIATALTCLGSALNICLNDMEKQKLDIIKKLNDAARILCDTLYIDTRSRRSLILATINKEMKDFLIQSEPQAHLFGENLSEKIKTAKAVQQSGKDLKLANKLKQIVFRKKVLSSKENIPKNKALNSRGPPHTATKRKSHAGGPAVQREQDRKYRYRQK
ncbi:uncharacterized protein LOC115445658 [Manduca sexta]|uniref:uncharacterized protein LOC115445658 n=1 Tax=Manduca sexta TaxID=7130 RepID=UPI00188ECDB2|nr:uncharacterized protein LOC115445658 [Manduca sexta]